MANLHNIVYLSEEQKATLFSTGSVTANVNNTNITVNYNPDDLYITPQTIETNAPSSGSSDLITSGAVYAAIHNQTQSGTTGISIADHTTTSIYGVQSTTNAIYGVKNSNTTASKITLGTNFTVPNVTGNSNVIVPIKDTTATIVPIKNTTATTVPIKDTSATACDDITNWNAGSGDASLTFTIDNIDTKQLNINFSHTHTAPSLSYTAQSIIGVQSTTTSVYGVQQTTTSVLGVQSSTTTATKVTLGTSFSIPNVTGNDSVIVPIRNDTTTNVPIINTAATTVVTGASHVITDTGHIHNI